jgi:hypothetical protein
MEGAFPGSALGVATTGTIALTEAHWLDSRLTEKHKEELTAKACRNMPFTLEQWRCAVREVHENNKPIDVAKQRCGILE